MLGLRLSLQDERKNIQLMKAHMQIQKLKQSRDPSSILEF